MCLSLLPSELRPKAHLLNELIGVDCEPVMDTANVAKVKRGVGFLAPPPVTSQSTKLGQRRQSGTAGTMFGKRDRLKAMFELLKAITKVR